MKINTEKRTGVEGYVELDEAELFCSAIEKYGDVRLATRTDILYGVPFAHIKLYRGDSIADAHATFEDASALGKEIVNRFNNYKENLRVLENIWDEKAELAKKINSIRNICQTTKLDDNLEDVLNKILDVME